MENHIALTMPATTVQNKAHVIRANLSTAVLGFMENTQVYTKAFKSDLIQIWATLEALYVKPNQQTHALAKLRTHVMEGYQLSKYHIVYV
jgi:predicted transglutaminase-like protease